jgi:hypothetical protein
MLTPTPSLLTPSLRCTALRRYVDRLERIHAHVKEAEEETQLSRREFVKKIRRKTSERLKEMQKESRKEEEEMVVRRRTATAGRGGGGGTVGRGADVQSAREAALRRAKNDDGAHEDADALSASSKSIITEGSEGGVVVASSPVQSEGDTTV